MRFSRGKCSNHARRLTFRSFRLIYNRCLGAVTRDIAFRSGRRSRYLPIEPVRQSANTPHRAAKYVRHAVALERTCRKRRPFPRHFCVAAVHRSRQPYLPGFLAWISIATRSRWSLRAAARPRAPPHLRHTSFCLEEHPSPLRSSHLRWLHAALPLWLRACCLAWERTAAWWQGRG